MDDNHWTHPLVQNALVNQYVRNASYSMPRGSSSGTLDGPRRNVDDECQFPRRGEISLEDYAYLFERCSIAARVVELEPRESWKVTPLIFENEDGDTLTAFEQARDDLSRNLRNESWYQSDSDEEGDPVWSMLQLVDELSGIGEYGVLLLGLEGDEDLSSPANGVDERGRRKGKPSNQLVYLRAYDQTKARIARYETDRSNPRYGLPVEYRISVAGFTSSASRDGATPPDTEEVRVHWTRVIHIADTWHQSSPSRVSAIPRMRPVYNELLSIRKIAGASGEFYWNHGSRDLIFSTHPQLGGKVRFPANFPTEVEKFQTGLQRWIKLAGMDAKTLNPAVADPTPHLDAQIRLLCIKKGVPERVFRGSERGELSSSQDERDWAKKMMARERSYNTSCLIVPLFDRLIQLGVLPEPKQYFVHWPNLLEQMPQEKATIAAARMDVLTKYIAGNVYQVMAPVDLFTREMDYSQEEAESILKTATEEAAKDAGDEGRSPLLGTVGGLTGIVEMFKAAGEGVLNPEQLKQILMLFFSVSESKAGELIAEEEMRKAQEEKAEQQQAQLDAMKGQPQQPVASQPKAPGQPKAFGQPKQGNQPNPQQQGIVAHGYNPSQPRDAEGKFGSGGGGGGGGKALTAEEVPAARKRMKEVVKSFAEEIGAEEAKDLPGQYYKKATFPDGKTHIVSFVAAAREGQVPYYSVSVIVRYKTSLGGDSVSGKWRFTEEGGMKNWVKGALSSPVLPPGSLVV